MYNIFNKLFYVPMFTNYLNSIMSLYAVYGSMYSIVQKSMYTYFLS